MRVNWNAVLPAVTTPFEADLKIDHRLLGRHGRWLIEQGSEGLILLGSLGEGATLTAAEKREVLATCHREVGGLAPLIAGISALSTAEAVALARDAEAAGCAGLMVLPPYVYSTDWREMKAHMTAVIAATGLPCMLYNNPPAYRTDFTAGQIAELAGEHANLEAVKESSGDVRRITALRAELGDRLAILVGVDDLIVEGIDAGATGWVAGLVNAFPAESVALFRAAREGRKAEALALYRWFLPLLRMDTVPKFVQLIKLAQERAGWGDRRVRPPRLPLIGEELREALVTIEAALAARPEVDSDRAAVRSAGAPAATRSWS